MGKINLAVKGVKNYRSTKLALTLPFAFCEYILFKGKSMYTMNEGIVIESFQQLINDLDTVTYSTYILELIDIAIAEGESNFNVFKDAITSLYMIKNKAVDLTVIARSFEIRLLNHTGYGITLDKCCICKTKIISSNYFDIKNNGGVCKNCEKVNGIRISFEAYSLMNYIASISIDKLYNVKLKEETSKELYCLLKNLISNNYLRKPKSLEIFNMLHEE